MSRFVCSIDNEGQVCTCLKEDLKDCRSCEFNDEDHKKFVLEYCSPKKIEFVCELCGNHILKLRKGHSNKQHYCKKCEMPVANVMAILTKVGCKSFTLPSKIPKQPPGSPSGAEPLDKTGKKECENE
jgi:hypothetical protein